MTRLVVSSASFHFGCGRLGQPWHNGIRCREKRKEQKKTKIVTQKSEAQEVFDHIHQLLMDDLFLENYFMIFGKRKDTVIIEIPVPEITS